MDEVTLDSLVLSRNIDTMLIGAKKDFKDEYPNEGKVPDYLFGDVKVSNQDDLEYVEDSDLIQGFGQLVDSKNRIIGQCGISIHITSEIAVLVIQAYIKKMNKVKAVLEATK
jgi:hypothetical protein